MVLALVPLLAAASVRPMFSLDSTSTPRSLSTEAARMLSLGRGTTMAMAVWIRTVDQYASGQVDPDRIAASVHTIGQLDPTWVEPWFFGVLMLPDSAQSQRLAMLEEAAGLHPDVPWFAWRAGMSQLGQERQIALEWLQRAADAPGADPAYAEVLDALVAQ